MPTSIILVNFTDQGIRNIKDSPSRLEAFRAMAGKLGVSVKSAYYVVGPYDMVITVDGMDEAVVTALLKVGSLGHVKTQTLRAFAPEQMEQMVSTLA